MRIMLLLVFSTMSALFFELSESKNSQAIQQPLGITEKEKNTLIEVAYDKARALGYKPEALNLELSKDESGFKAYFYPKQKTGVVIYGGTLTIYLDQNGKILRFIRGI